MWSLQDNLSRLVTAAKGREASHILAHTLFALLALVISLLVGLTYALTGADESAGILLGYLDAYACARSMRNGNARVRFQDGLVAFFAEETGGVIHVDAVIRHVKDLVDANEWKTFHAEYMQKLTDGAASNDGSSSSMS